MEAYYGPIAAGAYMNITAVAEPPVHIDLRLYAGLVILLLAGAAVTSGSMSISSLFSMPWAVSKYLYQRYMAWKFLFHGVEIMQEAYTKARGKAFRVYAPDHNYLFVSNPKHYKEVIKARGDEISLHAATKQMWQPKYTMHKFNWHDIRGVEGIGYVKAIRTMLTNHLPKLMPDMRVWAAEAVDAELSRDTKIEGGVMASAAVMFRRVMCVLNAKAFFGNELGNNKEFIDTADEYTMFVIVSAETLRLLPDWIKPLAGKVIERSTDVQARIFHAIDDIVQRRMDDMELAGRGYKAPQDCVQWIIDTAPKDAQWDSKRVTYEIIGIWFGSVHATSITITQALYDLCKFREYLEPLRVEIESGEVDNFVRTASGMPMLDSFVKESARMHGPDALSVRRGALRDFRFSDGTVARKGEWIGIPQQAIHLDDDNFPHAQSFNGFRFVDPARLEGMEPALRRVSQPEGPSSFTDVSANFHLWGTERMACPGRFYTSDAVKLILIHLLSNYDFDLADSNAKLAMTWRTYMIPREDTQVIFRPRASV